MKKTFAVYSFGCRVNQAEMEDVSRQLSEFGYQMDNTNPSVYIINTCAVTAKAEREARQLINQIRRRFPKTRIVITGCAATKWTDEGKIVSGAKLISNKKKEDLANLIAKLETSPHPSPIRRGSSKGEIMDKYLSCGRMILKIQDGCQRFCSYCIVPYLRGKPKSERIMNLVSRIMNVENDIKEVILTAINTQAYGYDTGETFNDLIKNILIKTKIKRLSFGSINPWSINHEFIQLYKQFAYNDRFIDFFHIPLQSGSNKILNLMKRGYTREEFMEKLNIINRINPFAFIGTDIIAGFLDETDKDFRETYDFLDKSPISKFHIFRFSLREKTAAFYMANRLEEPSPQKKMARARILANLGKKKYRLFLEKHIGKTFPALLLNPDKNHLRWALLSNQIPIVVDTNKKLAGEIKMVKINRLLRDHLQGDPL